MNTKEELNCSWRVYLTPLDIVAEKEYHCPIEDCIATFQNASHLQMHITRHHRIAMPELPIEYNISNKDKRKHFFCPSPGCSYYQTPAEITNGARHFTTFRSLKQHYLKVHGERKFGCHTCDKSFATVSFLRHHQLSCGRTFKCKHCSISYGSREALLTHARRKQHGYSELISPRKKPKHISVGTQTTEVQIEGEVPDPVAVQTPYSSGTDQDNSLPFEAFDRYRTNDEDPLRDRSEPADLMYAQSERTTIEESAVVCTETQTDFMDVMYPNPINHHDPLLSYTHMYTQTSDDQGLVVDLGLSTIETQTSWNDAGDGFGDYLVSTETQTNFDIDGFSDSNDKTDQSVTCKNTQLQESSEGAAFLSAIGDTIADTSVNTDSS